MNSSNLATSDFRRLTAFALFRMIFLVISPAFNITEYFDKPTFFTTRFFDMKHTCHYYSITIITNNLLKIN